jgi:predicted nucleotidyltransferase
MADKNSKKDERKKDEPSVEQNVSPIYVPKSKLGNLPTDNTMDPEMKKEMDKTKDNIEKFKKEITKQFKYIEGIGIIPAQAAPKIEEEFEVPVEECKKKLIHLLVIIPEDSFKEIQKVKSECIKLSKSLDEKLWVHVLTPVDVWNLGLDSKFDILEAIGMVYPILDKGLFGALRVASIHKSLVLRKFEKYITSYVIGGSLVRGTTKPTSDVDVFIIIDDTDVKRMPRFELKEKLRSVIFQFIQEATAIAGCKNPLSPQVYLLTEFWEAVKDAHPVMFTFIRDGIPLYDRGTFLPWKSLLRMGKIKPSPEALDMFMSSGDKLEETIQKRIFDIATLDLFWGISTPTQGLMMLYGKAPGNVYDTVKEFKELFVEKEKLIEPRYADILEEISIKVWKAYEHGKLKPGDIDGKELDRLAKNALDYMKRLKELRKQIEKRMQDKSIQQTCDDVFGMLETILGKKGEAVLIKAFDDQLVKHGKMPKRFLENIKAIVKTRNEFKALDKDKKKKITIKEVTAIEDARKMAAEITNTLIEYAQRKDFVVMDRKRFVLKVTQRGVSSAGVRSDDQNEQKDKLAEVFFLTNLFIVEEGKIWAIKNNKFVESNVEELNKELTDSKEDKVKITPMQMELIKQHFGEFELSY